MLSLCEVPRECATHNQAGWIKTRSFAHCFNTLARKSARIKNMSVVMELQLVDDVISSPKTQQRNAQKQA